jgi:NADPH2:quinone reductase
VKIEIGQTFALADVGQAHAALQGRKTTGSTILIP